jgi:hypothetical protein
MNIGEERQIEIVKKEMLQSINELLINKTEHDSEDERHLLEAKEKIEKREISIADINKVYRIIMKARGEYSLESIKKMEIEEKLTLKEQQELQQIKELLEKIINTSK